jgi:hypothetical protein
VTAEQLGRRFGWLIRRHMRRLNAHPALRERLRDDLVDIFEQVLQAIATAVAAHPELTPNERIVDQFADRVVELMLASVKPSGSDP